MEQVFQKLVRDRIPEKIEKNGEVAVTRILNDEEYRLELYRKLREECEEVIHAENSSNRVEELADVLEVVKAIAILEGKTIEDVLEAASKKAEKRGGFQKRIFLEKTYSKGE